MGYVGLGIQGASDFRFQLGIILAQKRMLARLQVVPHTADWLARQMVFPCYILLGQVGYLEQFNREQLKVYQCSMGHSRVSIMAILERAC